MLASLASQRIQFLDCLSKCARGTAPVHHWSGGSLRVANKTTGTVSAEKKKKSCIPSNMLFFITLLKKKSCGPGVLPAQHGHVLVLSQTWGGTFCCRVALEWVDDSSCGPTRVSTSSTSFGWVNFGWRDSSVSPSRHHLNPLNQSAKRDWEVVLTNPLAAALRRQ